MSLTKQDTKRDTERDIRRTQKGTQNRTLDDPKRDIEVVDEEPCRVSMEWTMEGLFKEGKILASRRSFLP